MKSRLTTRSLLLLCTACVKQWQECSVDKEGIKQAFNKVVGYLCNKGVQKSVRYLLLLILIS